MIVIVTAILVSFPATAILVSSPRNPSPAIVPLPILIAVIGTKSRALRFLKPVPYQSLVPGITLRVIPSPASWLPLIVLVEPLLRVHPVVMFREGGSGVLTCLTVVVLAVTIRVALGVSGSRGQRGEQNGEKKNLHSRTSLTAISFYPPTLDFLVP
jgi:hypothetical protein